MKNNDIVIELVDVKKNFENQEVLKGINLKVRRGESLVIIGESGGGKSVLMKHIIGLLKPDSGKVIINGEDIASYSGRKLDHIRKKCAYLFQSGALFDSMTVLENVMFPLKERTSLSHSSVMEKAHYILNQVGLEGMYKKYPAELSGGMQKRVALARALVMEPEILLFDEPTTGLDPLIMCSILDLINQTHAMFKYTGIIISHEVPTIFEVANRVAMLHEGEIIAIGTPDEIVNSNHSAVYAFIGETCSYRASSAVTGKRLPYDKTIGAVKIKGWDEDYEEKI